MADAPHMVVNSLCPSPTGDGPFTQGQKVGIWTKGASPAASQRFEYMGGAAPAVAAGVAQLAQAGASLFRGM